MARETIEILIADEHAAAAYRVRRDAVRAPEGWRPVFAALERRLFDLSLRVTSLRAEHGLLEPRHTEEFKNVYGYQPKEYLTRARVETAVGLLHIRDLQTEKIAPLVGFASRSSFDKAFCRIEQKSPSAIRTSLEQAGLLVTPEPNRETEVVCRLFVPKDSRENAAETLHRLRRCYARARREGPTGREALEVQVIAEWWKLARLRPHFERRLWLFTRWFKTPALFELLCGACREEGRGERRRGLELAELAVDSLGTLRGLWAPAAYQQLEARGLAELGNAQRLLLDFEAAARNFELAELRLAESVAPPRLCAEVLQLKSCLRRDQRRWPEALELVEQALAVGGQTGRLGAEMLLNRGYIFWAQSEAPSAIADFQAAFELLENEHAPYLTWVACQGLAAGFCATEDLTQAEEWLERGEPHVRALGQQSQLSYYHWLRGLLASRRGDLAKAEKHLRRAHGGFETAGNFPRAGVASLDLAMVYLGQGKAIEAGHLAAEALPQLQAVGLDAEGTAALVLLHQALNGEELTSAVLERVRCCVGRAVSAPDP